MQGDVHEVTFSRLVTDSTNDDGTVVTTQTTEQAVFGRVGSFTTGASEVALQSGQRIDAVARVPFSAAVFARDTAVVVADGPFGGTFTVLAVQPTADAYRVFLMRDETVTDR